MSLLQAEHTDRYELHVHIVSYLAHTKALLIKQTRYMYLYIHYNMQDKDPFFNNIGLHIIGLKY